MLLKRGHGHSLDIYSLGTILYEFVTGSPPFYSKNVDKMYNNILKEELHFPEGIPLSKELKSLLNALLEKNPEERIGFKHGIKEILSHPWCTQIKIMDVFHKRLRAPLHPDYITLYFEDIQEQDIDPVVYEKVTEDIFKPFFDSQPDPWFQDFYFEKPSLDVKNKEERQQSSSSIGFYRSDSESTRKSSGGQNSRSIVNLITPSNEVALNPLSNNQENKERNRMERRLMVSSSLERIRSDAAVIKESETPKKQIVLATRENFHEVYLNFTKIVF